MTFHVVWDWNGTLFDDVHILARCTSASSESLGGPIVTVDDYKTHYTRPLSHAYERILGRPITDEEMTFIGTVFHDRYAELMYEATLARDASDALMHVSNAGATQSVLTMWVHEQLLPFVDYLGITHHFNHLQGQPAIRDATKAESLRTHLGTLSAELGVARDHTNTVMIGDTIDDGLAATETGISCVLLTTGPNNRAQLAETGWPVCDSVFEAASLALGAVS